MTESLTSSQVINDNSDEMRQAIISINNDIKILERKRDIMLEQIAEIDKEKRKKKQTYNLNYNIIYDKLNYYNIIYYNIIYDKLKEETKDIDKANRLYAKATEILTRDEDCCTVQCSLDYVEIILKVLNETNTLDIFEYRAYSDGNIVYKAKLY